MGINAFTDVGSHTHKELKNIEIGVSSAGSNAGSAVSITIVDKDGTNYARTDWLVTSAWTQTAGAPDGVEHTDQLLTDPLALGWNKDGVIRLKYVGSAANGTSDVIYNGVSGASDDGVIKFNFENTDYNVEFASKDDITIVPWEVEENVLPVEARDNNTISVVGKTNWRFQDDVIGPTGTEKPAVILGERYSDAVIPFNRGDTVPANPRFITEVFFGADIGSGPEWVSIEGGTSDVPIVRYTADGLIVDRDHRAIFETGAVNMTLPASTENRLIQMVSEGPTTIITADGTEQFTSGAGTSVDSKLTINETFKWATIIGRTAGEWSQYVGQVGLPAGVDESTPTKFKAGTRLVQNGVNVGGGSVTFPETFKAGTTPTVMILPHAPGDNINATLQSVSETGFAAWIVRNESDVGMTKDIHWIAIGEIS